MLVLNPRLVTFGGESWEDVAAVSIDRVAARLVEEWSDAGPHAVFVDAPERRVTVRVVQEPAGDAPGAPLPGDSGELVVFTAPGAGDAGRKRVSCGAVVTRVEHEVSLRRGSVRTVTLAAVSADGAADPIAVEDAGASVA